jgi:hypothetical protein
MSRERPSNVGQRYGMPCVELKLHPKRLYGVFGDSQWTNKERLPDALLTDFLEHFPELNLSNSRDSHIIGKRSKSVPPLDAAIEYFKSAWRQVQEAENKLRDIIKENGLLD